MHPSRFTIYNPHNTPQQPSDRQQQRHAQHVLLQLEQAPLNLHQDAAQLPLCQQLLSQQGRNRFLEQLKVINQMDDVVVRREPVVVGDPQDAAVFQQQIDAAHYPPELQEGEETDKCGFGELWRIAGRQPSPVPLLWLIKLYVFAVAQTHQTLLSAEFVVEFAALHKWLDDYLRELRPDLAVDLLARTEHVAASAVEASGGAVARIIQGTMSATREAAMPNLLRHQQTVRWPGVQQPQMTVNELAQLQLQTQRMLAHQQILTTMNQQMVQTTSMDQQAHAQRILPALRAVIADQSEIAETLCRAGVLVRMEPNDGSGGQQAVENGQNNQYDEADEADSDEEEEEEEEEDEDEGDDEVRPQAAQEVQRPIPVVPAPPRDFGVAYLLREEIHRMPMADYMAAMEQRNAQEDAHRNRRMFEQIDRILAQHYDEQAEHAEYELAEEEEEAQEESSDEEEEDKEAPPPKRARPTRLESPTSQATWAKCPVCLDPFSESANRSKMPRALDCGHLVCATCTKRLRKLSLKQSTEAPTCPICKSSVQWKITPEIKEVAYLADQLSATNQLYFGKSEADKVRIATRKRVRPYLDSVRDWTEDISARARKASNRADTALEKVYENMEAIVDKDAFCLIKTPGQGEWVAQRVAEEEGRSRAIFDQLNFHFEKITELLGDLDTNTFTMPILIPEALPIRNEKEYSGLDLTIRQSTSRSSDHVESPASGEETTVSQL